MGGRLAGKVALITGGAKGLGRATSELFAREQARVIIADIDSKEGEGAAAATKGVLFRQLDVTSPAEWQREMDAVCDRFGRLDILVNNAGVLAPGTIESESVEQWDRLHSVIARGTFLGCQNAVRVMRDRGGGAIVNVASIASLQGMPYAAAYCAAKGAVEALTRSVAVHCSEMAYAIRCNSVHPGSMATPMIEAWPAQVEAASKEGFFPLDRVGAVARQLPLGSVAEAILFMAGDASRGVNGTKLVVDEAVSVMSVMTGTVSHP